ncbi:hypothetical protein [Streptomyces alboflavus]|uniref:hypothetical protein n=1 Tax=Streptomyces alboflavus TaxID=67267 RepID=UPI0004C189D9|nr:hypothetical protein [Streptomyces alboflavus]
MNESTNPQLSFSLRADALAAILRVDQIRHDTLVSLVATWASDDEARDDVIAQLDALAEAVASPREGELDALVEQVEDAAAMDDAQVEVDLAAALRLRDELDEAITALSRFNPARAERPSKGASLIKHPSHARTRAHLAETPLPEQRGIGGAA